MEKSLVIFSLFFCTAFTDQTITKKISLRPNRGPDSISVELNGRKCEFSYNIVGGSSEEWEIEFHYVEMMYACNIERPTTSYLFFTEFSAEITDTELAEVDVWDNEGIALRNDIYEIHHNRVVNPLGWEGTIRRIWLVGE